MGNDLKWASEKVYVSTYCVFSSYGSILQSYALKKVLGTLGVTSSIISKADANDIHGHVTNTKNFSVKRILTSFINFKNRRKISYRKEKNLSFIHNNIDLFDYNSYNDLKEKSFDSKLFLAGSDQIFHPALCNPVFFLDFVSDGAKRISYAASMGSLNVFPEKEKEFGRLLNNFDFLSFREKDAAELAKKYTDKQINVHVDPTFLISANEWRTIEKEYPIFGKYILLYPLYWDRSMNSELKELHKKTGLPIVLLSDIIGVYHQKAVYDAGVEQFLWLIDHAEYVVTSSFHGAALSIILNKKLSMVVNSKLPSRMNNLSEIIHYPIIPIDKIDCTSVAFEKINNAIEEEKEKSILYLKRVLFDE